MAHWVWALLSLEHPIGCLGHPVPRQAADQPDPWGARHAGGGGAICSVADRARCLMSLWAEWGIRRGTAGCWLTTMHGMVLDRGPRPAGCRIGVGWPDTHPTVCVFSFVPGRLSVRVCGRPACVYGIGTPLFPKQKTCILANGNESKMCGDSTAADASSAASCMVDSRKNGLQIRDRRNLCRLFRC